MRMSEDLVKQTEKEIDAEIHNNPLLDLNYAQAMWTLLSVVEDHNLKIHHIDKMPHEILTVYVDVLINKLSHPLRAIHFRNKPTSTTVEKTLIDDHYGWANDWLDRAESYDCYCSIIPLWHRGKIPLSVEGNVLITNDWKTYPLEYEVYNRLVRKDGSKLEKILDPNELMPDLMSRVKYDATSFELNLNPRLAKLLIATYSKASVDRYTLPDSWRTSAFTFGEFKAVFNAIQAILYGRFLVRAILAGEMAEHGFAHSVWMVTPSELCARLVRYTRVKKDTVHMILEYLTFGQMNINFPDIATQPLVDLRNGYLALSPFIWNNSNAERNLCVLLNQIEEEREIYSRLTLEKENLLCREIEQELSGLGYEFARGDLGDTDLDFAIIDRQEKACICLELKWFIEPAEIREIIQRSEELAKGVSQAKKILRKYLDNDKRLIEQVLNIDSSYVFAVGVGSRNWIGHFDVQDEDVPIIKVKHFLEKIKELGSLKAGLTWLNGREYLPKVGVDYEVVLAESKLGKWSTTWYGIKPII